MRFADITLLLMLAWPFMAPNFGGGMDHAAQSAILGVPPAVLLYVVGVLGIAIGCGWIHRIARGEPQPEANDRFWWSRA
jgi:hypothetical protein